MFYKNKKVLVTGGTGFIGANFVNELLTKDAVVRIPIHKRRSCLFHKNIETVHADLTKMKDCLKVCDNIDYVIHAAGAVGSAAVGIVREMETITANLILSSSIMEAAWKQKVDRFLLFGSSTAYPPAEYPIKEHEMWTTQPYEGYMGYGWMRRYLEKLAEFVHNRSNMKIAIARPSAVYGDFDNFDLDTCHVLPALIRKAVKKENPYTVWGDGNDIRDFIYVTDFVEGSLLLLEKYAVCDPVNIAYGVGSSIKDVVKIILKVTNHANALVKFDTTKPSKLPVRLVDISKSKELLNFIPKVSLENGICQTVKWFNNNL